MKPIERLVSPTVVLAAEDIDTDQIIPAQFLTTTTRAGLGRHLFHAWRYDDDGAPRSDFILNQPAAHGCEILVAGRNFGCGSSREHAPWALLDFGFRAVISSEIADIFRSNALKNGLLAIVVEAAAHEWLLAHPGTQIEIDLEQSRVHTPTDSYPFEIDGFSRHCLMRGMDELGFLLEQLSTTLQYEQEQQ
ncbi:MAG: 3-isopropylmalate dehydratase small subunit, partial [Gammaproteobacteria bacterium]|nr:3-isopropylmalate dehydratase small subunit [Gammaproteobacteria bacterium]